MDPYFQVLRHILFVFIISLMRAVCLANCILLDLIALLKSCKSKGGRKYGRLRLGYFEDTENNLRYLKVNRWRQNTDIMVV
jgi:hypothetical protein